MTESDRLKAAAMLREISVKGPLAFVKDHSGQQSGETIAGMLAYLYERIEAQEQKQAPEVKL